MASFPFNTVIVGSGFFGSVLAERIATVSGQRVLVLEKRNHAGGNSYSEIHPATGIECHMYGSHIFHTKSRKVWDYITQFARFNTYQHRVLTEYQGFVYTMPISLMTINAYYKLNLCPSEAEALIRSEVARAGIRDPKNLEEKAISLVGEALYDAFVRGYTAKQWGRHPRTLPPQVITRLPVRTNYNINYFNDPFQGIPLDGYGEIFKRMLANPNIEVMLETDFFDFRRNIPADRTIVYTGMIDKLFDCKFGSLAWRSLSFEWESLEVEDYQGTAVMNFADEAVPYTRIHEFKHYHPERTAVYASKRTRICREYPKPFAAGDEPFYAVNDEENQQRYSRYVKELQSTPNVIVGGRLGGYRYWDMDQAIEAALLCFETTFADRR